MRTVDQVFKAMVEIEEEFMENTAQNEVPISKESIVTNFDVMRAVSAYDRTKTVK